MNIKNGRPLMCGDGYMNTECSGGDLWGQYGQDYIFFFFQAEDGIRDYKVTGVQTCALPIWPLALRAGTSLRSPCSIKAETVAGTACSGDGSSTPSAAICARRPASPMACCSDRVSRASTAGGVPRGAKIADRKSVV